MQCKNCIAYIILQCTTLDRLLQCNAKCYLFNKHLKELVLVCNAMQKVHKCYSLVHSVRSFVQCNAMLHNISYLFTEHEKELDLVCNAMQELHSLYYSSMHNVRSFVQCNAKCYLFSKHLKELVLVCNAKQCKKCTNVTL